MTGACALSVTLFMFNVGSREPRGDLFEHLEKDRPLPAPKEGVPVELPERRDEQNR